jgi:predicted RNA-binding protein YlxR (DUF448 family)
MMAAKRQDDMTTHGPMRRCAVTGAVMPKDALLRFVLAPDGQVVPDLAGKLPGRGIWVTPRRDAILRACRKNVFARALKRPVRADEALADRVAAQVQARCLGVLGLARRAGVLMVGFDQVRAGLRSGAVGVLVQACDAAEDGRGKLRRLAAAQSPAVRAIEMFEIAELDRAIGRANSVHIAIASERIADRFMAECARLESLTSRFGDDPAEMAPSGASGG